MKKNLPYILIALIVAGAIVVFWTNNKNTGPRKLDQRLSFHRRDKIPYGLYVAYNSLATLFPQAAVISGKKEPGLWDGISADSSGQALIIITPEFNADDYEMKALIRFAEKGNTVFLSSRMLSDEAEAKLKLRATGGGQDAFLPVEYLPDTLSLTLEPEFFRGPHTYSFPGKRFFNAFSSTDYDITTYLGTSSAETPQFVELRTGAGHIYIHLAPIAFTNYFLLHKSNMTYYEQVMSLIPAGTSRIYWDEYYRYKVSSKDNSSKGWFSVLMNMKNSEGKKPFRAAIIVVMILLLLYVLLEMRRKQRIIPLIKKEANASLEFTKTIGRLYHDKGDHNNLARKMTAYFLEYVRSRYKLSTTALNEEFVKQLYYKTGVEEGLITDIIYNINQLDTAVISEQQLAILHKQLETFYKNA